MKDYMMTLACTNKECLQRIRVGRILSNPVTRIGAPQYCVFCGQAAVSWSDVDEDYWEVMANAYNMPVQLIKMLYDVWNPHEFEKFSDHVENMKKEALVAKAAS